MHCSWLAAYVNRNFYCKIALNNRFYLYLIKKILTRRRISRKQNNIEYLLCLHLVNLPSVLWRCCLGGRKGIRPVKKTEWWGACVVVCLEQDTDLHMAQLMPLPLTVSCFSKIQIGFTFLVPAHLGSPGKRAVKRVCVTFSERHMTVCRYNDKRVTWWLGRLWCIDHSIMINVTWCSFDQTAKQLIVGHTTMMYGD